MMKYLLMLTLSSLILAGCKNGFSEYKPEERKAIMEEHDKQWRELREDLRKKRFFRKIADADLKP